MTKYWSLVVFHNVYVVGISADFPSCFSLVVAEYEINVHVTAHTVMKKRYLSEEVIQCTIPHVGSKPVINKDPYRVNLN